MKVYKGNLTMYGRDYVIVVFAKMTQEAAFLKLMNCCYHIISINKTASNIIANYHTVFETRAYG